MTFSIVKNKEQWNPKRTPKTANMIHSVLYLHRIYLKKNPKTFSIFYFVNELSVVNYRYEAKMYNLIYSRSKRITRVTTTFTLTKSYKFFFIAKLSHNVFLAFECTNTIIKWLLEHIL
jgi:hypothetical protein